MSIKAINDQGALDLIEAVIDLTVRDFMVTTPQSESRKEIEREILSDHFEALTGLNGPAFLKHLEEQYAKKKQKARKGKKNDDQ